jgi:hypothetical protein
MTKTLKLTFLAGIVALAAACAQQQPEPVVIVEPVPAEPAMTKF